MTIKLAVDLVGVCFDFTANLRSYLVAHAGFKPDRCPPPTRWEFYRDWGMSTRRFLLACDRATDAGWLFQHDPPIRGARPALWSLANAGAEIHLITARGFGKPGRAEQATRSWLREFSVPFDTMRGATSTSPRFPPAVLMTAPDSTVIPAVAVAAPVKP